MYFSEKILLEERFRYGYLCKKMVSIKYYIVGRFSPPPSKRGRVYILYHFHFFIWLFRQNWLSHVIQYNLIDKQPKNQIIIPKWFFLQILIKLANMPSKLRLIMGNKVITNHIKVNLEIIPTFSYIINYCRHLVRRKLLLHKVSETKYFIMCRNYF